MLTKKCLSFYFLFSTYLIVFSVAVTAQNIRISNDSQAKQIKFGNDDMQMTLNYNYKASLSSVTLHNQAVIESDSGMYSFIKTKNKSYSTLQLLLQPTLKISNNKVVLFPVIYGDKNHPIKEIWTFTVTDHNIQFGIQRTLASPVVAEQVSLPVFMFTDTSTWEGAYQDYGGLAWFYLFNKKLDTYGVHSSSSQFWNSKTNNGLDVQVSASGNQVAMDYSRTANDELAYTIAVAPKELVFRFDSGTHRRRFLRDRTDVWAPVTLNAGTSYQTIAFSYFNVADRYGRGKMEGINGKEVSDVLNTIARIGVIDKQHFGGNSWHTPYGPICLHEQYIAQLGLAINDMNYLKGYRQCLDFYRDNAIRPDGRVWPRWAYSNEDAMPGKYTSKGFYEAQWGYLLDSNPDFVTNVSDLYNQTGDKAWVKTQQQACEKALEWIIARDSNNNGLVEMMTDSTAQKRGSDWIDIIWASYENAFVNAKLYHALVSWADIEKQLSNSAKANHYQQVAQQLKTSFNKPVTEGGFWDEQKKCYIHWRDKDGSVHGNNMVTPVNFMAIAYNICDDENRKKSILDGIETQMQKENLFFWPLCLYSYNAGEGNDWQFPFPAYENGDIFLSWGSVAVKAYAGYKPELALKYVKNVLAQYAKDGLAFQRYGRAKQDGLGDDILAGNCLSVVGLYQSIYGINPLYNRLYVDPHITPELAGTEIKYNYRNQKLTIGLNMNKYTVSNGKYQIRDTADFGFYGQDNALLYFHKNSNHLSLEVFTNNNKLALDIHDWNAGEVSFTQSSDVKPLGTFIYQVNDLAHDKAYTISIDDRTIKRIKSNSEGTLQFTYQSGGKAEKIVIAAVGF